MTKKKIPRHIYCSAEQTPHYHDRLSSLMVQELVQNSLSQLVVTTELQNKTFRKKMGTFIHAENEDKINHTKEYKNYDPCITA